MGKGKNRNKKNKHSGSVNWPDKKKTSPASTPTQVLQSSTSSTTSSPAAKAGLNSSTIAKNKDKGKGKNVDDTKADDGHDYERGTDVKVLSPSMDGLAGDVPPSLTSGFTNEGASGVSMEINELNKMGDGIAPTTTKAGLNSLTKAKNKDTGKKKVDDAKTDEGHDYERGTDVKVLSPSMDGTAGDVPPTLIFGFTNEGTSEVSMEINGDGIAERVLYGSGRRSLPAFEEQRVEEDNQAMCENNDQEAVDGSGTISLPAFEKLHMEEDNQAMCENNDEEVVDGSLCQN